MTRPPVIMVVAAEASGDILGADLIAALRARSPDVRVFGLGGERMTAQGVESPFDYSELSIFGILEAFGAYGRVMRRVRDLAALAARERPDVAVLIDSWGFTSRLGKALRRRVPGVRLVKYVGPQVWASRPGRAKTLTRIFDHLLAILPFDLPFYEGFPATFVGNPVLAREPADADAHRLRARIDAKSNEPILLLLPGSRGAEIRHVMPAFEEAAALLKASRPALHVVIPVASTVADKVKARVAALPFKVHVIEDGEGKIDAMKAGTVAMACSGTVTTELALAGCPMVVGYRMSRPTFEIAKRLIRTPYAVLLNIAMGRMIVPELMQDAMTPEALAQAAGALLDDPRGRSRQVAEQNEALKKMGRGGPDPSEIAADVIVGMLAKD